jgi:hypothetical protein
LPNWHLPLLGYEHTIPYNEAPKADGGDVDQHHVVSWFDPCTQKLARQIDEPIEWMLVQLQNQGSATLSETTGIDSVLQHIFYAA